MTVSESLVEECDFEHKLEIVADVCALCTSKFIPAIDLPAGRVV
jgi:hypothetical protein